MNHVIFLIVKVGWRSLSCWQRLRERMCIVGLPVPAACNLGVATRCSAGTWDLGWTFLHQWGHCRWKMLNFWPRNSTAENLSLRKQSILQTKIIYQKMLVPVLFLTSWTPQDKSENNSPFLNEVALLLSWGINYTQLSIHEMFVSNDYLQFSASLWFWIWYSYWTQFKHLSGEALIIPVNLKCLSTFWVFLFCSS